MFRWLKIWGLFEWSLAVCQSLSLCSWNWSAFCLHKELPSIGSLAKQEVVAVAAMIIPAFGLLPPWLALASVVCGVARMLWKLSGVMIAQKTLREEALRYDRLVFQRNQVERALGEQRKREGEFTFLLAEQEVRSVRLEQEIAQLKGEQSQVEQEQLQLNSSKDSLASELLLMRENGDDIRNRTSIANQEIEMNQEALQITRERMSESKRVLMEHPGMTVEAKRAEMETLDALIRCFSNESCDAPRLREEMDRDRDRKIALLEKIEGAGALPGSSLQAVQNLIRVLKRQKGESCVPK